MKTNLKSLFLILAIAVPFLFTSCGETENQGTATITFDNITGNTLEIEEGANFAITGSVISEDGTTISSIVAYAEYVHNGQTNKFEVANSGTRGDNTFTERSKNDFTFRFEQNHPELSKYLGETDLKLTIEAEVKNGGTSSRSLSIVIKGDKPVDPDDTPLSAKTTFTLGRPGVADAPASANGIEWTSNPSATTASFAANNFVLTKEAYDAITTKEELAAAADGKSFATNFQAQSDANFGGTKYYIIQDGSTLRLVEFTALNFAPGANRAHFTEKH